MCPSHPPRVLLTGFPATNAKAAATLAAAGAACVELRLQEPRLIPKAICLLPVCDLAAFTSPEAARLYGSHLLALNPLRLVAALGPATAEALADYAVATDLMPSSDFSAQGLLEAILARRLSPGTSVLLPCSARAGTLLERGLAAAGFAVFRHDFYEPAATEAQAETLAALAEADGIVFFSPSAVHALAEVLGSRSLPQGLRAAAIGPTTREALHGLFPSLPCAMPAEASARAAAEALLGELSRA